MFLNWIRYLQKRKLPECNHLECKVGYLMRKSPQRLKICQQLSDYKFYIHPPAAVHNERVRSEPSVAPMIGEGSMFASLNVHAPPGTKEVRLVASSSLFGQVEEEVEVPRTAAAPPSPAGDNSPIPSRVVTEETRVIEGSVKTQRDGNSGPGTEEFDHERRSSSKRQSLSGSGPQLERAVFDVKLRKVLERYKSATGKQTSEVLEEICERMEDEVRVGTIRQREFEESLRRLDDDVSTRLTSIAGQYSEILMNNRYIYE
tara:strand:- start:189 stop:965 length:777 start_codon:yes stop_codon:yes gene_type:complete